MLADKDVTRRKDKRKRIHFLCEGLFLLAVLAIIIDALFIFSTYQPYDDGDVATDKDHGFVALSYFGVDRTGTNDLIGVDLFDEHLAALHKNGYVTLTGKDIQDYYHSGKALPKHALFLNFEDGRRDTIVFAEKLLEKYNYHAAISTYADNLSGNDSKFLRPDELKALTKQGYWELGTNGYRLYYINVFDRWHHYLGNMNPVVYSHLTSVLGRDYNHYLMDYVRDDKNFPVETYQVMKDRISDDYTMLRDTYTEDIGYVPEIYTLMHANTGRFGNHEDVSRVNEKWIRKLFKMNFNREGDSHNDRQSSIYDLTRMEPRAYWPVNHLLMRIHDDGADDIRFEKGDVDQYAQWDVEDGAAEFKNEAIYLTTAGKGKGQMSLKGKDDFQNLRLTTRLKGNQFGTQKIFLRANHDLTTYIVVGLVNNNLVIGECRDGAYQELQKVDLQLFDGQDYLSEDEDKKEVASTERQVLARYGANVNMIQKQLGRLAEVENEEARTVAEGSPEYRPTLSYHKRGNRQLNIELRDDLLSVNIDGRPAASNVIVSDLDAGRLVLGAQWPGYGYSQTNLADDVYDAVFDGLKVTEWAANESEGAVLYDVHYQGWQKWKYKARIWWRKVLDWTLAHF